MSASFSFYTYFYIVMYYQYFLLSRPW